MIRFTVPAGASGTYAVSVDVHPIYSGPPQGDTDFHVLKNGVELFGQMLAAENNVSYSNSMELAFGDTVEFAIGRGADGTAYGSGLIIEASLSMEVSVPEAPRIVTQPQNQTVFVGSTASFSVVAEGTAPLSYQWRRGGSDLQGATNASLILENVEFADAGNYTVLVTSAGGTTGSTSAVLTVVEPGTYDVGRDFSVASNPNGAWSYGYVSEVGGSFTAIDFPLTQLAQNGVAVQSWQLTRHSEPAVFCNTSDTTATSQGSEGVYPPDTVWFFAGYPETPQKFGVIRLTLPTGEDGFYKVEAGVRHYLDGPTAGDTDFHIAKSGSELFGQFLTPTEEVGYTNIFQLAGGDTIDFVVGRGRDDNLYGSGLKIAARISRTSATELAPLILAQPRSETVAAGANVTLAVGAEGTTPLTYQWQYDGSDLDGATGSTLHLESVDLGDAGEYRVLVSNAVGSVLSLSAVLTVIAPLEPGTYDVGRDFSVASNPNGAWSYGYVSEVGGSFTAIDFPLTQLAQNGVAVQSWQLTRHSEPAVFCNTSDTTATSQGSEGVYPPDTVWFFAGYPETPQKFGVIRLTLPTGEDGFYKVEAGVRHYLDGPTAGDTDFHIAKNGSELFGQFLTPTDQVFYTNILRLAGGDTIDFLVGRGGDDSLYGSGLKIAARISRVTETGLPPVILVQPQSHMVVLGSSVTLSVTAEGTGPLSYQWRKDDEDLVGATNPFLTLEVITATDGGRYSVQIGNAVGSVVSAEANVKVITPPLAGSHDLSRDFSPTDNPNGAWSFGWLATLDGDFTLLTVPHVSVARGIFIPSWQLSSYLTPAVYHNNTSNTVSIAGGEGVFPPGTTWFFPGEDGRAENYGVIRFTVPTNAGGLYQLATAVNSVYQGSLSRDTDFHVVKNGAEIFGEFLPANSARGYSNILALAPGNTVDFVIGRGADASQYASGLKIHAEITRLNGSEVPPFFVQHPQSQTVTVGASVTFSAFASGTGMLSYQWQKNGVDLPGETTSTLTLEGVQSADVGRYRVQASNALGSAFSVEATLIIESFNAPPEIVQHPASRSVRPGKSATFAVTAKGTQPLSFQWQFRGTDLLDATNAQLVIESVSKTNAGAYRVIVSNRHGTVASLNAILTVTNIWVAGSVNFANRGSDLDVPIFDVDGTTPLSGQNYRAQLYAGPTIGTVAPVGPSVAFQTNGYFFGGVRVIQTVVAGQRAYLQVRAWDHLGGTNYETAVASGAKVGSSTLFSLTTGGDGLPPTQPSELKGLESFRLSKPLLVSASVAPVIRPSRILPDGTTTWKLFGEIGASYVIECSVNLRDWRTLTTVINANASVEFFDPDATTLGCTFYRARSMQ